MSLIVAGAGCTFVTSPPTCQNTGTGSGSGNAGSGAGAGTGTGGNGSGGAGPVPMGEWVNATSNLANLPSICGTLGLVSPKPDEDLLIAGVAENGLWSSTDGGDTWERLGDSESVTNRISTVAYDPDEPQRYWEAGTYGNGVYLTEDNGAHFVQQGDVQHVDFLSIDFTDPDRQLMLAGGHEQERTLYRSTDGGKTWPAIGAGLPSKTFCTQPLIIDRETYIVGCSYFGAGTGIQRTTDSGKTWKSVSDRGGVVSPLRASDGTIYWIADFNGGFVKSTDNGETWSEPQHVGDVKNVSFIELPDQRLAAVGQNALVVSSDQGDTWQEVTTPLPFTPMSISYSTQRKAFYITHFDCGNPPVPVAGDSIMRYDFE